MLNQTFSIYLFFAKSSVNAHQLNLVGTLFKMWSLGSMSKKHTQLQQPLTSSSGLVTSLVSHCCVMTSHNNTQHLTDVQGVLSDTVEVWKSKVTLMSENQQNQQDVSFQIKGTH